jgi:hypothetical protein
VKFIVSNNFIKNNIKCDRNIISVDRCGYKNSGLTLQDREWVCAVKKQLGMSLPEVTLTECNALAPRRSKKKRKIISNTLT